MLNVIHCASPDEKTSLFAEFDPSIETWVVSDLQSKWHLQRDLLERFGVLEDTAVMRATELWKHFAFQLRPELKLLSVELAQTLIWNWMEPMQLPWAKSPRAVQVVLDQMGQWMSLFADPQHPEIMAQWFRDNPESYVRWGHWFELCSEIWRLCQERQVVMVSWLPAVLLSEDLSRLQWDKQIKFDLGPQVTLVEGLLIKELGRQGAIHVLCPSADWVGLMQGALKPYEEILGVQLKPSQNWQPSSNQAFEFKRFSTQLAEVKEAVAQTRLWLDQGVPASRIAIVAPDIEAHWPALRLYAKKEGLPICKSVSARLGTFVELSQWMANLRTASGLVSSADLEMQLFAGCEKPRLSFDEFRVLFTHIYDPRDLARAQILFESSGALLGSAPVRVQDFLTWALGHWRSDAETTHLLALLQVIGQEVPRELLLPSRQWLSYLEGLLARREIPLEPAAENGVWCVSLSSANWLEVTHAIFLNLCENDLRYLQSTQVRPGEAQKIFQDTGYALSHPDRQELEFELLWLLEKPWSAVQLLYSESDFSGAVLTPSRLWMWASIVNGQWRKKPQIPQTTRWDELQRLPLADWARVCAIPEARHHSMVTGLKRDVDIQISTWRPLEEVRLSASSLERYHVCPFVFATQRLFKQSDEPLLDLDLDHRTRGRLLHALLEEVLRAEPLRFDLNPQEIAALVDRVREEKAIQIGEPGLWPAVRAQHVRLVEKFLHFEQAWRARFPHTRTVGIESDFLCHWDLQTGEPVAHPTPIVLSGRLDRVDVDSQGRYAVLDYKASSGSLRNWSSWLTNHDYQMGLYTFLVEQGSGGLAAGPVVAANYYVVQDEDRRKGFHQKDESAELYSPEDKHRNWISETQKADLFSELKAEIQNAVQRIMQGEFRPLPEVIRNCDRCAWRTLCRAPHLN